MPGKQTIIRPGRVIGRPPAGLGRGGTVVRAEAAVSGLESLVFAVAPTLLRCIEWRATVGATPADVASELGAFEYRATRGGGARAQVAALRPVLADAMHGNTASGVARIELLLQDPGLAPDLLEALHHCVCVGFAAAPSLAQIEHALYVRLSGLRDLAAGPLSPIRQGDAKGFSILGPRITARSVVLAPLVATARALDRLRMERAAAYPVLGPKGSGKSSLVMRLGAAAGPDCVFVEARDSASGATVAIADELRSSLAGILVTLDVTDLLGRPDPPRTSDPGDVRRLLSEIDALAGGHLPVYTVVTKVDRIPGFEAYFAGLDERERAQLWGATFDIRDGHSGRALRTLPVGFDALTARLQRGLTQRLHEAADARSRELLYAFPRRVAASKAAVLRRVEDLVGSAPGAAHHFLRGVYLTSSGTGPTDRGWFIEAFGSDVLLRERALYRRGRWHLKW